MLANGRGASCGRTRLSWRRSWRWPTTCRWGRRRAGGSLNTRPGAASTAWSCTGAGNGARRGRSASGGGSMFLNSQKASVEMPLVFRDAHEFDALSAQISWARGGGETELWINNVSFSNAHLAGTVSGLYRTAGTTSGAIDLTGRLTRADARFVGRYIPHVVGKTPRDWLPRALYAPPAPRPS